MAQFRWRDAGEPEHAFAYFVAGAEAAERGWAKQHAADLYREALRLVPEDDGDRRRDVTRRLALAEAASYHVHDARLLERRGDGS